MLFRVCRLLILKGRCNALFGLWWYEPFPIKTLRRERPELTLPSRVDCAFFLCGFARSAAMYWRCCRSLCCRESFNFTALWRVGYFIERLRPDFSITAAPAKLN